MIDIERAKGIQARREKVGKEIELYCKQIDERIKAEVSDMMLQLQPANTYWMSEAELNGLNELKAKLPLQSEERWAAGILIKARRKERLLKRR